MKYRVSYIIIGSGVSGRGHEIFDVNDEAQASTRAFELIKEADKFLNEDRISNLIRFPGSCGCRMIRIEQFPLPWINPDLTNF
jgi:hypothetical protein